jgi:eukaryotic-like serine/threonine-protein kinase
VVLGRLSVFFAARDLRSGAEVLVKAFRDTAGEGVHSLSREMRALKLLKHPNILEIIDYNFGGGTATPFLVVPWCRGGNLAELRGHSDFLPLERVLPLLRQVASAIDYAHANGVIHGDIKPHNVLLTEDLRCALLCDFGMAKYFDVVDRVDSGSFRDNAVGGTSAYLSPEQLAHNSQSTRSDIYSFGLVAYELLSGRLPFDVRQPLYHQLQARVTGKLLDPLAANPNLTTTVQAALNAALAVSPEDRPATATSFCELLVGGGPSRVSPPKGPQSQKRWKTWNDLEPAGRAGVITAIVAAIAGVIVALVQILPKLLGGR